ncbi:MAG: hypothetical protein J6W30_00855 [Bacteroidales bacterium]|nr:hypothetical protein [Bacteroidales bacterium]
MGKIKQGILGGFKGKVGTVIGSSWNGIAYMKGQAQSVRNPKTAAQMTQRNFFKEVQELAAQISNEQLAFLFPNSPKNMTRRNMLAQQLAADPIITDNEKHVNLSSLTTIGNAPTAELPTVTIEANENFLNIFWQDETDIRTLHANEYPTVFVANVTKKKIFLVNSTVALGSEATVNMQVNLAAYGESGDFFSGFMLLTGATAAPQGFTNLKVTERPARVISE